MTSPTQGDTWQDDDGTAEVIAVLQVPQKGRWCVLQRILPNGKRGRPFLFSAASMSAGDDGWRYQNTAAENQPCTTRTINPT